MCANIVQVLRSIAENEKEGLKRITPAGGGGPASVIEGDWQLGGGVLPIVSEGRWEEECAAPNSVDPRFRSSGLGHHVRRSTNPPFRSSVALRRLDFRTGSFLIRCLDYRSEPGFCAVQYEHG